MKQIYQPKNNKLWLQQSEIPKHFISSHKWIFKVYKSPKTHSIFSSLMKHTAIKITANWTLYFDLIKWDRNWKKINGKSPSFQCKAALGNWVKIWKSNPFSSQQPITLPPPVFLPSFPGRIIVSQFYLRTASVWFKEKLFEVFRVAARLEYYVHHSISTKNIFSS